MRTSTIQNGRALHAAFQDQLPLETMTQPGVHPQLRRPARIDARRADDRLRRTAAVRAGRVRVADHRIEIDREFLVGLGFTEMPRVTPGDGDPLWKLNDDE
ncbi:hypothetical protein [Burkholderia ubonensis]|uniref:hypothetical protein n=1 Tax=Burkholderia ubonensis TaxID=101571 RepID=UPI0012FA1B74|nr:hypothetical protein [Burkholderia ubonensis]